MTPNASPLYDGIGHTYATTRREDPDIAECVRVALGDADTVVNVGAGTGCFEPRDREVVAIEPSEVMAKQRPRSLSRAIHAWAHDLPLADESTDAAMALLSVHHWGTNRKAGVKELRRVARGPVVILTYDATVSSKMWLTTDYLRQAADADRRNFPPIDVISRWLGGHTQVHAIPVARETPYWMYGAFWGHPERVLDAHARVGTSHFAAVAPEVAQRAVSALRLDISTGAWDARYGHLRTRCEHDVGLRLLINSK